MLITLYKYRKGSGPSATTRKYMCFISNASAPSVLEYTFRWMYVLSRTISLYIIFWMEIVTYHLLCSPISGNWWSLSSLSTSLSSIFKKGWVLIFIMCWGSGGPSDVLNEGPNKRNKTQPHFSRQCETSRQWRLPVRLLLFRLHRSIQICIHQLPTFLSFSCRLSSFDCWLLFLLSSMNIPFIETWLLTDPFNVSLLYMCKKFKKVMELKIWILCSFDFFLIWKVLIYFYYPEKIGPVAILL